MYMYTDIIGIKSYMYDRYQVEYATFTHQVRFERVLLYVLLDEDNGVVACRDQSQYIVTWFYKGSEIWV